MGEGDRPGDAAVEVHDHGVAPGRVVLMGDVEEVGALLPVGGDDGRVLPKIISVDDHVVEPPHVWQTYLPQRYREKGPRVERDTWGDFEHKPGAKYVNTPDPDGLPGDPPNRSHREV